MIEDQENLIEVEEKILISLNSYNATVKNNGYDLSDLSFSLKEPFIQDHKVLNANMSILSFTCPNSQYIINNTNNILVLNLIKFPFPDSLYIKLINGNYNANSFMTMFLNAINTQASPDIWTMVYNSDTYKYTLSSISTAFSITQSKIDESKKYTKVSRIGLVMGFEDAFPQPALFPGGGLPASITFDFPVNFGSLNSLNINLSNLKTNSLIYKTILNNEEWITAAYPGVSYEKSSGISSQNIAISVPVNCNPGEVIYYNKIGTFEFNLKESIIEKIDVKLTDDLGNLLQLNNQNWNMTIEINLTKVVHKKTRNFFEIIQNPFPKISYIPQY